MAVVCCAWAPSAWALEPFVIQDMRIEGLQRVEPGTVFLSLPFRNGDTYTDEKGSAAIRALFGLGLFKDVRIDSRGQVLIIRIEERPTVDSINFVGFKEFDANALKKALQDIGLAEGRPFDAAVADRAEEALKREYINKSLYGAHVALNAVPIANNRVRLNFTAEEGKVAKIRRLHIKGNQAFSESNLKDLFTLSPTGFLSFYTKNDRYTRSQLKADLETLRSYYLSRGYLEFKIKSALVSISPDKQHISLFIYIHEGQPYTVSGVRLAGNYLGKENKFRSLVQVRPGKPYNAEEVVQTTKAFTEQFGHYGFAFARVEPVPEIDKKTNRVTMVLQADPGRRVYVRRINIGGNTQTRDQVIRRELRQMESSWYDGDKIRLSRDRVDRLGYFKEVKLGVQELPGSNDQVDLNLDVTEKPNGNLLLGVGYSSTEKLSLQFSLQQDNIFGSGHYLGLNINTSKYNQVSSVSWVNPYFTSAGVSRAVDVYERTVRPYDTVGGDYKLTTNGLAIRFGVPFTEFDRVFFGLGAEQTKVNSGTSIPAAYLAYADQFGASSRSYPFSVAWSRDDRDSALSPTKGQYQRAYGDLATLGDVKYLRTGYEYQGYWPLSKRYTLGFNADLGWGTGLNSQPYPIFKNFTAGGLGSVRGFEQGSLGPRDVTGAFIGGAKKTVFSTQVIGPFPGAGNDNSLRLFGFYDIGNVFSSTQGYDLQQLRSSVGLGMSWISPIGPLNFSIAKPIKPKAGDRIQEFQFQVGTSF